MYQGFSMNTLSIYCQAGNGYFLNNGVYIPYNQLPLSSDENHWLASEFHGAILENITDEIIPFFKSRVNPFDQFDKDLIEKLEKFNDAELQKLIEFLQASRKPPIMRDIYN